MRAYRPNGVITGSVRYVIGRRLHEAALLGTYVQRRCCYFHARFASIQASCSSFLSCFVGLWVPSNFLLQRPAMAIFEKSPQAAEAQRSSSTLEPGLASDDDAAVLGNPSSA